MKMKMEIVISNILRIGVVASAAVTFIGGIFYLSAHLFDKVNYGVFHGTPKELRDVWMIISDAFHLKSESVIEFGVILLIATPIARVLATLVDFIKEKDHIYICITTIVLIVLSYSLFWPVLR